MTARRVLETPGTGRFPDRRDRRRRDRTAMLVVVALVSSLLVSAATSVVVPVSPAAASVPTPLHGWHLDETTSGTFADYGSGTAITPNTCCSLDYLGVSDKAVLMDGAFMNVGNHYGANGFDRPNFTVAAYVQLDPTFDSGSANQMIARYRPFGFNLSVSPTGLLVAAFVTTADSGVTFQEDFMSADGTNVKDGAWHQVALSFDGTDGALYLDGGLVDTEDGVGPMRYDTGGLNAGMAYGADPNGSGVSLFHGIMDEPRFWDVALTPDEIREDWASVPEFVSSRHFGGSNDALNECVCSIAGPVTVSSGNNFNTVVDVAIGGRGSSLGVSRTYNSQSEMTGTAPAFGWGWTFSYGMNVADAGMAASGGGGGLVVTQENGATATFGWEQDGHTSLISPNDQFAELVLNGDGTLTFTRRKTQIFTFHSLTDTVTERQGKLKSIEDLDGNTTTLDYHTTGALEGKLQTVTEAHHASETPRTLSIAWDGGHIDSITDSTGRVVDYGYANDELISVVDVRGQETEYVYEEPEEEEDPRTHRLVSIRDPRNNIVEYNHYDGQGRVDWQRDGVLYDLYGTATPDGTHPALQFAYTDAVFGTTPQSTTVTSAEGRETEYVFARGLATSITYGPGTAEGVTWLYTYDANHQLATVAVKAAGASGSGTVQHTYTWDAAGNRLTDTDSASNPAEIEYNAYNQPTKIKDRRNTETTNTYSTGTGHGWRLTGTETPVTYPGDSATTQETELTRDSGSNHPDDVIGVNDAMHLGSSTLRWDSTFDTYGNVTAMTDPEENQTTFGYDLAGRRVWTVAPKGNAGGGSPDANRSVVIHDNAGLPLVALDANGAPNADGFNRPDSTTSVGSTTAVGKSWTALGSSAWGISNGRAYATVAGVVKTAGSADGTVSFTMPVAQTGLGAAFRVQDSSNYWSLRADTGNTRWNLYKTIAGTDTLVGSTATAMCCGANQRIQISYMSSSPYTITVKLNGVTRLTTTDSALAANSDVGLFASAAGSSSSGGFIDAFAAYTSGGSTPGSESVSVYDASGNLAATIDGIGNYSSYTYDKSNQLTTVTSADSSTVGTGYDLDHLMVTQTDANAKTTSYAYDSVGRVEMVTDPLGRDTTYGYNPEGTVAFKQDDGGSCTGTISACTTYTYDAANRLQTINYSEAGTPDVSGILYDDNGNRTEMVDTTGKSCYAYDSLNRLRSYTNGGGSGSTCNGVTVASAYDLNNNVTTLVYPGSLTVTRGFDDANRLVSVQDFQASLNTVTFGYDPNSNLITETRPNGTDGVYTYSASNELNNVLHQTTSGSVRIAEYAYTRDLNSQLVKTVTNPGGGSTTDTYGYNALNKITTTNAATYTYDTADNAKGFISGAVMTYDDANQPVRTNNGSTSGTLNRCYSYDGRGNRSHMILKGSATSPPCNGTDTTYNYDQANRFLGINGVASYTYNGDGLRMQKSVLTVNNYFAYDMVTGLPKPVRVGAQSGTACTAASNYDYYIYGPGGMPIKKINRTITAGGPTGGCSGTDTTTATWTAHDQQGSTRLLFDSSGATVGTYDYDPYGQVTAHTGNNITLGYTGQWTDGNGEGGFQYLRARYYDPITAQFLTTDLLIAKTRSAYSYAMSSPLSLSDPTGLNPWDGYCVMGINCGGGAEQATDSWKRENPEGTQNVANAAGGLGNAVTFGAFEQQFSSKSDLTSGPALGGYAVGQVILIPLYLMAPGATNALSDAGSVVSTAQLCWGSRGGRCYLAVGLTAAGIVIPFQAGRSWDKLEQSLNSGIDGIGGKNIETILNFLLAWTGMIPNVAFPC